MGPCFSKHPQSSRRKTTVDDRSRCQEPHPKLLAEESGLPVGVRRICSWCCSPLKALDCWGMILGQQGQEMEDRWKTPAGRSALCSIVRSNYGKAAAAERNQTLLWLRIKAYLSFFLSCLKWCPWMIVRNLQWISGRPKNGVCDFLPVCNVGMQICSN